MNIKEIIEEKFNVPRKNPDMDNGIFYLGMLIKMHPYTLSLLTKEYHPNIRTLISMIKGDSLAKYLFKDVPQIVEEVTSRVKMKNISISFALDGYCKETSTLYEVKSFNKPSEEVIQKSLMQALFERDAINSQIKKPHFRCKAYTYHNGDFNDYFIYKKIDQVMVIFLEEEVITTYIIPNDFNGSLIKKIIYEKATMVHQIRNKKITKSQFYDYCQSYVKTISTIHIPYVKQEFKNSKNGIQLLTN